MQEDPSERICYGLLELLKDDDGVFASVRLFRSGKRWYTEIEANPSDKGMVEDTINGIKAQAEADSYPDVLLATLVSKPYRVRIAQQRISSTLQIDTKTGTTVGSTTPTFTTTGADSIATGVLQKIADTFKSVSAEQLAHLQEKAASIDANEAGNALGKADFSLYSPEQRRQLLELYRTADLANFDPEDRLAVLQRRIVLATEVGDYELARNDARNVLRTFPNDLTRETTVALQTTLGIYAALRGNAESALVQFSALLDEPELDARQRGWLWRNLSLTLDTSDPEAKAAAQYSADAFLQAGEKDSAAGSLMRVHACLALTNPKEAAAPLTAMIGLFPGKDLYSRDRRAHALHLRAKWLWSCSQNKDALADAKGAASLYRNLVGREKWLAQSLYLAAFIAKDMGLLEEEEQYRSEADALWKVFETTAQAISLKALDLLVTFNASDAVKYSQEADALGNYEASAIIVIARAFHDHELTLAERIELLENCIAWEDDKISQPMRDTVRRALADLLMREGYAGRALAIFKELSEANPIDFKLFATYIQFLWDENRWGDAASAIADRMRLVGSPPGLQFAYGKSLHMAGDSGTAIPFLQAAKKAATPDPYLKPAAEKLLEEALDTGAMPRVVNVKTDVQNPVTLGDIDQLLADFAQYLSRSIRMDFWKNGKWVSHPEKLAEVLLQGFIKARFGARAMTFRQIRSGAGVVDILAQFFGGLSVIIELKMCGGGYSSTYAEGGEEQLLHYLPGLSHIGYLVVLDGRMNDYGKPLLTKRVDGAFTLKELLIDMRPSVKTPKKASN